jgi:O-antigen/teichoic acid export membrane protein
VLFMLFNFLRFGVAEGIVRLTPFITTIFLAAKLEPSEFAWLAIVLVTYEIFFIVSSNNIVALTRIYFFKKQLATLTAVIRSSFQNSLMISVTLSILLFCFTEISFQFSFFLCLCVILRNVSTVTLALLQCKGDVKAYSVLATVYSVVFLSSLYCSIELFNFGRDSWLYALILASFFQFCFALIYFLRYLPNFFKIVKYKYSRVVFILGLGFMPQAIGWWAKSGADRYLILGFYGELQLASYSLAYQFSAVLLIFVNVINLVFVPFLNKMLFDKEMDRVKGVIVKTKVFVILFSALLCVLGYFVVEYFYIEKFDNISFIFVATTLTLVPFSLVLIDMNILYYYSQQNYVAKIVLFSAIIQLFLASVLAQEFPLLIYISVSFVVNFIMMILITHRIKRYLL